MDGLARNRAPAGYGAATSGCDVRTRTRCGSGSSARAPTVKDVLNRRQTLRRTQESRGNGTT